MRSVAQTGRGAHGGRRQDAGNSRVTEHSYWGPAIELVLAGCQPRGHRVGVDASSAIVWRTSSRAPKWSCQAVALCTSRAARRPTSVASVAAVPARAPRSTRVARKASTAVSMALVTTTIVPLRPTRVESCQDQEGIAVVNARTVESSDRRRTQEQPRSVATGPRDHA